MDAHPSLLARIQSDLRSDTAPAGDFELDPDDRSVQFHSCHGQARQVEVLRDAILHLLADDPTLREEDIVVLCPSIEQFAPLVEAGFGTSADVAGPIPAGATPRVLYRIADRSLRDSYPMLSALESLLDLVSGRCTASAMLEFLSLSAVRERFDFDDDALSAIAGWIATANVRWGFDGEHRALWGVSSGLTANTWRAALDQVLMGVAVSDDDIDLAPSGIAPLGVEGSDIALVGRFADVVSRLAVIADDMTEDRTVARMVRRHSSTPAHSSSMPSPRRSGRSNSCGGRSGPSVTGRLSAASPPPLSSPCPTSGASWPIASAGNRGDPTSTEGASPSPR